MCRELTFVPFIAMNTLYETDTPPDAGTDNVISGAEFRFM